MSAMLEHAPADRHVKAAILQMLDNSCCLATKDPETAATCFAVLKIAADDLINRGPAQLHAHAVEHGLARDIGPSKLRDAPTSQTGVLELLEPWFVDAVSVTSSPSPCSADEVMLAVLCVFGHVVTAYLVETCPELGAKLGTLLWADAKTVDRMRIKWMSEYGRDFGALLDFVRFSLTCPDQATQEMF